MAAVRAWWNRCSKGQRDLIGAGLFSLAMFLIGSGLVLAAG